MRLTAALKPWLCVLNNQGQSSGHSGKTNKQKKGRRKKKSVQSTSNCILTAMFYVHGHADTYINDIIRVFIFDELFFRLLGIFCSKANLNHITENIHLRWIVFYSGHLIPWITMLLKNFVAKQVARTFKPHHPKQFIWIVPQVLLWKLITIRYSLIPWISMLLKIS